MAVDDSTQDRCLLPALLASHGHDAVQTDDSAAAIETVQNNPSGMIIAAILMQGMDRYALCREGNLRDGFRWPNIRGILCRNVARPLPGIYLEMTELRLKKWRRLTVVFMAAAIAGH